MLADTPFKLSHLCTSFSLSFRLVATLACLFMTAGATVLEEGGLPERIPGE